MDDSGDPASGNVTFLGWVASTGTASAPQSPAGGPQPRLSKQEFHAALPPGMPFWKSFTKTRLGRDQRDTLERVYAQSRFPSVRPTGALAGRSPRHRCVLTLLRSLAPAPRLGRDHRQLL